jgi:hypothetical protein
MFLVFSSSFATIGRSAGPDFPTKFEFVLNRKTSKVLGLDVSPLLQRHVDEVIKWGDSTALDESGPSKHPPALKLGCVYSRYLRRCGPTVTRSTSEIRRE